MARIIVMEVTAVKTRVLVPPKDDLLQAIAASALSLADGDCVAVSSKAVSIWQGRCVPADPGDPEQRQRLAQEDAQWYLARDLRMRYQCLWTVTSGTLIGNAGIDASNGDGYLVRWPHAPQEAVQAFHAWLCGHYRVQQLAVIVTDSHTLPLRRGVVGCAVAWHGFDPLVDHCGKPDLFGRAFVSEHTNLADALAATAVLSMGETSECTPVVRIRGAPYVGGQIGKKAQHFPPYQLTVEDDVYAPFLYDAPWQEGDADKK